MRRMTFWMQDPTTEAEVVSVATAKKLLNTKGGVAFTEHYDRDGGLQEVTPIVPGNNARTTYRATYNTSKCNKQ